MVELKSGDTYNGVLEDIDKFMNVKLTEVTFTSKVLHASSVHYLFIFYDGRTMACQWR